ncbi:MAG: cytochrome d ubiquinol oxidase subunit II [Actinomycetota bacterium]
MGLADLIAALLFLGVIAYAVFGGADFGVGVWDLTAGNDADGAPLRQQIDRSIGPVWEANHVWLIYILVFLWSAFPRAFSSIMTTLFIPWLLVGLGIVLRGGAFAFRKFSTSLAEARMHGIVFAASSIITPFFLGMIAGAIASGRVPLTDAAGQDGGGSDIAVWSSWLGPTSWVGGALAVLTCAFLAGTFLAADAQRYGDGQLAATIGRRVLIVGVVTGGVAMAAAVTLELDATSLASGLHGRGLPLILLSALAGGLSLWDLRAGNFARARVSSVLAVATIVIGWGVGQYPDVLVDHATIDEVIGARSTQIGLVIVFGLAAVTAVPALVWLYVLVNGRRWARPDTAS